jgi:hypothetical protein
MNIVEQVASYNELVTKSFENAMGTMERVHQASVDLSVDLFKELGFWEDQAERYRKAHGRMLHTAYSSVVEVNNEFGDMIVEQAVNVHRFIRGVTDALLADLTPGYSTAETTPDATSDDESAAADQQ